MPAVLSFLFHDSNYLIFDYYKIIYLLIVNKQSKFLILKKNESKIDLISSCNIQHKIKYFLHRFFSFFLLDRFFGFQCFRIRIYKNEIILEEYYFKFYNLLKKISNSFLQIFLVEKKKNEQEKNKKCSCTI